MPLTEINAKRKTNRNPKPKIFFLNWLYRKKNLVSLSYNAYIQKLSIYSASTTLYRVNPKPNPGEIDTYSSVRVMKRCNERKAALDTQWGLFPTTKASRAESALRQRLLPEIVVECVLGTVVNNQILMKRWDLNILIN